MTIAVGTDHRGVVLREAILAHLRQAGHEVLDLGTDTADSVDYPDYATGVAARVADGRADRGVLICGTGIGMSIAANKVRGVRAALVYDEESVLLSRQHNDANVLVLPGNWLETDRACGWMDLWLATSFDGGRHRGRIDRISRYDNERESEQDS